ncbi:MAG: AI-2E family transporter [Bacillota bacterium]
MDKLWSLALRMIALLFIVVGAIWLLEAISWVVALLLVSLLIVYIFHPLLLYLKRRFNFNHGLATSLVFLIFLLICAFTVSLLIPVIYFEATELAESFPHYMIRFQDFLAWVSEQLIILDVEEEVRDYIIGLSDNIYQGVEYLAEASLQVIIGTVDFFLILFLVFYLLYDFQSIRENIIDIIPLRSRPLAKEIVSIVDESVGTFIRGSLIRCFVVGIVTGLVLFIIGMPYAFLLGLIAGIFNFILYIGPYIAAVPAVLLSFSPLTPSPLIIILVYVVVQVLDGIFLAPVVLGRIVKLKPITIIVAILAGGRLAGVLGMVLAVPVAGIVNGLLELLKQTPAYQDHTN